MFILVCQHYLKFIEQHQPSKILCSFCGQIKQFFFAYFFSHDVLIFLTGQEEIEHLAQQIRSVAKVMNGL